MQEGNQPRTTAKTSLCNSEHPDCYFGVLRLVDRAHVHKNSMETNSSCPIVPDALSCLFSAEEFHMNGTEPEH